MHFKGCKGRRYLVCDSSHKKVRKAKIIVRQNSVEKKLHSPKSFGAKMLLPLNAASHAVLSTTTLVLKRKQQGLQR